MPISTLITATDILVSEISTPTASEQRDIINSFQWVNRVLKNTFGVETFVIDAAFSKALLPHEPIEITQFLSNKDCTQWSLQANQAICQEASKIIEGFNASNPSISSSMMEKVELFVNDDFIQCSVDLVRFRVTVNSVHGMFLTAALEVFNSYIGRDDLFIRSLLLIKLWVHKEAKRFSFLDLSELFRHDSLVIITFMIFSTRDQFTSDSIDNPLTALICFLEIFSTMDWNSHHVTACGIMPNESSLLNDENSIMGSSLPREVLPKQGFTSSLHSKETASTPTTLKTIKEELTSILDHYRRYYTDHFVLDESDQFWSATSGGGSGHNTSSELDIDSSGNNSDVEYYYTTMPKTKKNMSSTILSGCVVGVIDPIAPGRNLCGSCSSMFHKPVISDQLRSIFSKGLRDLTTIVDPLLSEPELVNVSPQDLMRMQRDLISTVFPISYSLVLSRTMEYEDQESAFTKNRVYNSFCRNLAHVESSGGRTSATSTPPHQHQQKQSPPSFGKISAQNSTPLVNSVGDVDHIIFHATNVASKKVTEESIINLVVQALHQFGAMPIGEIGKQLQLMTNNADFPKLLKKRFGGLKKFISSHSSRFRFGDNHNFNPLVYVAEQDVVSTPPPSSTTSSKQQPTSPRSATQQQSALAMLATAVRDLPYDVLQSALIQTLQTSQHSSMLQPASTTSRALNPSAATYPAPNSAAIAQRERQIGLYNYGGRIGGDSNTNNTRSGGGGTWQNQDSDEDSTFLPLSEAVLNSRTSPPHMQLMEMYQQNPPSYQQQSHRQFSTGGLSQPQPQYLDNDDATSHTHSRSSRLSPQLQSQQAHQQLQQPQQLLQQRLPQPMQQPQNSGPPGIISQSTSSFTSQQQQQQQQQQQRRNNYL